VGMRKLLAFLIAFPLFSQSVGLSVSPASISPGGTAVLSLTFTDSSPSSNMAGAQWTLTPPSGATISAPTSGPATTAASKVITCGAGAFAPLCVDVGDGTTLNANVIGSGVLATFPVSVAAATTPGGMPFALAGLLGATSGGSALSLTTTGVTLTILSKYDLNGDGLVNAGDVSIMVQDYLTQSCTGTAAGVGDGKCDIEDVMLEILAATGAIH
jgi:hypothetical protein